MKEPEKPENAKVLKDRMKKKIKSDPDLKWAI